jgi:tetratricopeptide (TPR) repeat protein
MLGTMVGCAPPPSVQERPDLTPEQQQALADSLREVQERELKIIRSFAYSHYNNKAWGDAARYYAELADKDTGNVFNDYGKWAQCYIQMNVPADSVKMVYQRGLIAFPDDAYIHASLGHIYRTQGLLDSAVVHYEAAVLYNAEEIEYQKTLAELYTRVDRQLEAIELYRRILEQEPENKGIADILADLVRRHLSPDEYIASLEAAVVQFPDDLEKKFELARAYTDVLRNDEALAQLQIILEKEPGNVRALEASAGVYENLRDYRSAVNACLDVLKLDPNNTDAMVAASNCYREMGSYPQARTYARRALSKQPKMGAAYIALASIYEAAPDDKIGGDPPTYYDKLVYLIAYGLYQDARNTGDYTVLEQAKNHMNYLKESKLIPEYSDWFMHQNDKDPNEGGGYDWINQGWSEVRYIETYLEQISQK